MLYLQTNKTRNALIGGVMEDIEVAALTAIIIACIIGTSFATIWGA
jgi:hypothetical protein